MKPLLWVGSSLEELKTFPEDARRIAGHQLHLVQQGLEPFDWKAMPSVGPGVYEIRIHTEVEHRVFYLARFAEGIYVLYVLQKKTQKTPRQDLELVRARYRQILRVRRR